MARSISPVDEAITRVDSVLRTLSGSSRSARQNPATPIEESELSESERELAGRLMRINHCGEVCAQALYLGQGLTSDKASTRAAMQEASDEEIDHLAWCEERLEELGTHPSYLNPFFFGLSFVQGALSGLLGDRFNLGFVAATEEQVVKHLADHLERLPEQDQKSRVIIEQMREDEEKHKVTALKKGGADFPTPVKRAMTVISRIMTKTTYWV